VSGAVSIAGRADWLRDKNLQRLLAVLSSHGVQPASPAGVRNALIGQPWPTWTSPPPRC